MRQLQRFTLFFLFLVVTVTMLVQASSAERAPDALTIEDTEFGLAFINSGEELRSATRIQRGIETGAKLDRFPLYWNEVEPTAGFFDWSGQDAALRANEELGLGTLAILLGTAEAYWPSGRRMPAQMPRVGDGIRQQLANVERSPANCEGTPPATGLYNWIFTDNSDEPGPGKVINTNNPWARFVEQAVIRYRPGGTAGLNVRYWEIWNEPDLCHFWGGTSQEYVRLLKVAYLVIKHVDPDATVMWGGLAFFGPKYEGSADFFLEMMAGIESDSLAASYNGFFDAAAIHQYSNVVNGYQYSRRVQNALAGTGWENKSIWVTESGVPVCGTYPGPDCPSTYRGTEEDQASYIWQNIAYTRLANNNGPIFHFQLHDDGGNECRPSPPADAFGLFTNEPGVQCVPHNAEPRLAYYAYQQATQYFPDTELLWSDIENTTIRRVAFYHPATKERRLLVWAVDGRGGITNLAATGDSARRISLDGSEVTLTPVDGAYNIYLPPATNQNLPNDSTYTIGGKPYLLIEEDTQEPTATMDNLLAISPPTFTVGWEAIDLGSGIEENSVTIWSSAGDSGTWEVWLSNQPASGSASFNGDPGERYRFAVLATDRAGNQNSTIVPLAETLVNDGTLTAIVSGEVHTMRGQPAPWAHVTIGEVTVLADATGHFTAEVPLGQWHVQVEGQIQRHAIVLLEDTTLSLLLPPQNNAIDNGDFEQDSPVGISGWEDSGSSPQVLERQENTRDHALRLASVFVADPFVPGNEGSTGGNSTVSQELTVPAGTPYLALLHKVESQETDGGNGSCGNPALLHDKFEIIIAQGEDPPNYIHCQEVGSDLGWRFFDLSAYAGEEITLILNVYQPSPNRPTSALIDLITIGESPVLTPPTATPTITPTPSATAILTTTLTATPILTTTLTPTATPILTTTLTPTATPILTTTLTPTATPILTTTLTATPILTTTVTPTVTPTSILIPPLEEASIYLPMLMR